ncbi:MAG: hypothetical protein GU344_02310 [Thermocrinis sp.]|jgi:hypothetical protein|nr:hypothetical protein [Thermocrinis sp.]
MHMLLLIGVSVGFALSVLTSNNFYSERTFTSSANQWICNEMKGDNGMKSKGCQIAQASNDLPWNGGQWYNGGGVSSGQRSRDLVDIVEDFFDSIVNAISNFFRWLF